MHSLLFARLAGVAFGAHVDKFTCSPNMRTYSSTYLNIVRLCVGVVILFVGVPFALGRPEVEGALIKSTNVFLVMFVRHVLFSCMIIEMEIMNNSLYTNKKIYVISTTTKLKVHVCSVASWI